MNTGEGYALSESKPESKLESKPENKPENKKEAIRQAALRVIADLGFHNATADLISKEAGVAVGTIYNYFEGKDQILDYIFEVERSKRLTFYEEMRASRMRPIEKVERLVRFHFGEMRSSPDTARVFVQERRRVPCHAAGDAERPAYLPDILKALLEEGVGDGSFRKHDPAVIAEALAGATEAIISRSVITGDTSRLDGAVEEIMDLLRLGIESSGNHPVEAHATCQ